MGTPLESWPRRHRITVEDYYRMAEIGVLAPDARVELIEGEIIDMAPIGPDHAAVVDRIARALIQALGERAIVRVQGPVRLSALSEPEPDIAVLEERTDFYRRAHPNGGETLLIIEVSDTTLHYDRDVKVPLYARHAVREAWVVDIRRGRLLCCSSPANGQYARHIAIDPLGVVALAALPDVSVDLSGLLQPEPEPLAKGGAD
jgi:Uma2 family endonuclease